MHPNYILKVKNALIKPVCCTAKYTVLSLIFLDREGDYGLNVNN
jgi:isoprenylcysteine carboxyl methyltransferase (ICMT) family protein YpbQ